MPSLASKYDVTARLRLHRKTEVLSQQPFRYRTLTFVGAILQPGATCRECGHLFAKGERCERVYPYTRHAPDHYYHCGPCHETVMACRGLERLP